MLNQDYTSKLSNLKDVMITNVENAADQLHIYIELTRRKHTCPVCDAQTGRIHDYRMQVIAWVDFRKRGSCAVTNIFSYGEKEVALKWNLLYTNYIIRCA